MPGTIVNDTPGRIGPIGAGWTVELDAMPHSATAGSPSTGVVTFVADADYDAHLAMNNHSTFTFVDAEQIDVPDVWVGTSLIVPTPIPTLGNADAPAYGGNNYDSGNYGGSPVASPTTSPGNDPVFGGMGFGADHFGGTVFTQTAGYNVGGYGRGTYNAYAVNGVATAPAGSTGTPVVPAEVYEAVGDLEIAATISGSIDSVSLQGSTASFTQGTRFSQFATADIDVAAVTSGSPVGAFNLAWQLAGNNPCSLTRADGRYWSLRGHDVGFNVSGKAVVPTDNSAYKLNPDGQTTFRRWDVRDSFTSLGWEIADGEFWSNAGIGSSVAVERTKHTTIIGTTNLDERSMSFQFGGSTSPALLGFGPDDANAGTGKWFNVDLHGPTSTAVLTGQYRTGGSYVSISKSVSLADIDTAMPVQFIIDIGFPDTHQFLLNVYIQNVDTTDPPVVLSTGTLTTTADAFSAPWKSAGLLHGLYVTTGAYEDFDASDLVGIYEDWSVQPLCDLDDYGLGSPIMPYTGSLWDYLTQVCVARQVGLRLIDDAYSMGAMADESTVAQSWHPAASPTFAIDNSNTVSSIDVQGKLTSLVPNPVIFDALTEDGQYSMTPGTTTQVTITTTTINGLVYNPEPLYDLNDFLHGDHPYGGYIVTSANKNRIPVNEWITFGGSLTIEQTDANTLTLTIVAPFIPLPNGGSDGDYTIGVTDGGATYSLLKITSPAGSKVVDHPIQFETGASFVGSNSTGASISNVAATDIQSIQNTAAWALVQATGPNITLSGEFPLDDLRQWQSSDFGMVPGSTILYRNMQWRIMTATISNLSVQFTALPYLTYGSVYFGANWDALTVDDYAIYWEGKTYDDMATMQLSGPNYDWSNEGAISRFSLYPGGGSAIDDPGLLPDALLEPDPSLEPDTPGSDMTNFASRIYPSSTSLFPGSEEDQ